MAKKTKKTKKAEERYEGVVFIVGLDRKLSDANIYPCHRIVDMIHMAHADFDVAVSLSRPGYGTSMLAPLYPDFDTFCRKVHIGDVFDPEAIREINFQYEELKELYD